MHVVAHGDVLIPMRDGFIRRLLARLGVDADLAIDMSVPGSSAGVVAIPRPPGMSADAVRCAAEEVLAECRAARPVRG